MTGPENYREADECLDRARRMDDQGREKDAAFWQREALVRSNLALAAATALSRYNFETGFVQADRTAWYVAASEDPAEKQRVRDAREAEAAELAAFAAEDRELAQAAGTEQKP